MAVVRLEGAELKQDALIPDVVLKFGGADFVGVVGALVAPDEGTHDPHTRDVPWNRPLETVGRVRRCLAWSWPAPA